MNGLPLEAAKRIFLDIKSTDASFWPPDLFFEMVLLVNSTMEEAGVHMGAARMAGKIARLSNKYLDDMYTHALCGFIAPQGTRFPISNVRIEADAMFREAGAYMSKLEIEPHDEGMIITVLAKLALLITIEEKLGERAAANELMKRFRSSLLPSMALTHAVGSLFYRTEGEVYYLHGPASNASTQSIMIMLNQFRLLMAAVYDRLNPRG